MFEISQVGPIRARKFANLTRRFGSGRVGSGRVGSGRVGSGRVGSGRVGSGRVGSDRVGSGRVGSGRVGSSSPDPTSDKIPDPRKSLQLTNNYLLPFWREVKEPFDH